LASAGDSIAGKTQNEVPKVLRCSLKSQQDHDQQTSRDIDLDLDLGYWRPARFHDSLGAEMTPKAPWTL
jgi:hypothetical protein